MMNENKDKLNLSKKMMKKIKLTRTYGNQYVTWGTMEIEGTSFKCFTLENRESSHSPFPDKTAQSLPVGIYQVKIDYFRLEPYLRVRATGAHRHASIGRAYDLTCLPSGSIAVGKRFSNKESRLILGHEAVSQALSAWVTHLAERWEVPPGKYGYMELHIQLAEDFKYEQLKETISDLDKEPMEMEDFCEMDEEDMP